MLRQAHQTMQEKKSPLFRFPFLNMSFRKNAYLCRHEMGSFHSVYDVVGGLCRMWRQFRHGRDAKFCVSTNTTIAGHRQPDVAAAR